MPEKLKQESTGGFLEVFVFKDFSKTAVGIIYIVQNFKNVNRFLRESI